jgi:cytochrome c biogenesis protein CcdA
MNSKNVIAYIGIALALIGGYLWMINYISIALILWGITFLIIFRLKKLNKNKLKNVGVKQRYKHRPNESKEKDSQDL